MKEIEQAFGVKFNLLTLNSSIQKSLKTLKPVASDNITEVKNHYVMLSKEWHTVFKINGNSFFMYYHALTNSVIVVDLDASQVYFTARNTQGTFIYGEFSSENENKKLSINLKTKYHSELSQQNVLLIDTIIKHFLRPVVNVMSNLLGV